jgi:hypothetical protein
MKLTHWLLVSATFLALACNTSTILATPEQPSSIPGECPDTMPGDTDVEQARHYQESEFTNSDWYLSYTVAEYRITVTRRSETMNAVINFDTVIFCGVTDPILDDYYSRENFEIIFQYYDEYEFLDECQTDDLRLFELSFSDEGSDYLGRFWVATIDEDHVRETLIVFPVSGEAELEQFSRTLVPELSACK